jgi:hypothetical protein
MTSPAYEYKQPLPRLAVGHGADKLHALLNLWGTLKDSDAAAEAIDYIAAEYTRRTGQALGEPTD